MPYKLIDFTVILFYGAQPPADICWVLCFQIGGNMTKKNSKRREWTKTDVRELKTLAREKTPARKIARTLKRSEGATRQKAFSLGVSLDSRA
jgi:hypothetical protein